MKKLILLVAVAILALSACTPSAPAPVKYMVGTGSYTAVAPRNYNPDTAVAGRVQVNDTFATVVLDADGKFVYVYIDTAQNDGTFDGEGAIVAGAAQPTKKEKGDAYNMRARSGIGAEWFEQIAALEEWMIGKTLAEVKALPLENNYIKDGEDLKSSVTITVNYYLAAVEKAVANAVEVFDIAKVGAGSVTTVAPRAFNNDTAVEGRIQVNTTFAGIAYNADGEVIYVYIDTAQNQGTFDNEGQVLVAAAQPTKKEKGPAYNMKARSGIGAEWDEQIASLEEWMMGKKFVDFTSIPLENNYIKDGEDLKASVTITVDGYIGAATKATQNAIVLP